MKIVIIGVDHKSQGSSTELKNLLTALTESEPITVICEEAPGQSATFVQQIAQDRGIPWIQIDMTIQQRKDIGIDDKMCSRFDLSFPLDENGMPMFGLDSDGDPIPIPVYAEKEDGMREHFWLDRIEEMKMEGTAIIVCGGLHARPLAEKAQQRGHTTDLLFHPEKLSPFWLSEKPIIF